ncbi:MAG: hypothetical protein ACYSYT_07860, partial [Planctomycetota bacterium]
MKRLLTALILTLSAVSCTEYRAGSTEKPVGKPLPEMPRLTPRPTSVAGIDKLQVSLNGTWRFNPAPPEDFHNSYTPA